MEEPQEKKRGGGLWAVLIFFLFVISTAALFYYSKKETRPASFSDSGFNIATLPKGSSTQNASSANSAPTPDSEQSGLGMIRGKVPGLFGNGPAKPSAAESLAQAFTALCRANEGKVQSLALAYTRRYPAIRRYGKDWMSYPDLKKLNDDYMRNHDPVQFLKGLAASQNFGILVKKYAKHPEIRQFVQDSMKQASPQMMSTGISYISHANVVNGVAAQVAGALGFPPGIFNTLGGKSPQINQKAIMNSINTQLQALPQSGGQ